MSKPRSTLAFTTLVAIALLAACDSSAPASTAPPPAPSATSAPAAAASTATVAASATSAPAATATTAPTTAATATVAASATAAPAAATSAPAGTPGAQPVFSNPTNVTNQFYPAAVLSQTIALGMEGGEAQREEVTLLPTTKTIAWAGGTTEVRVVQFAAYGDGKLLEVAYDYLAQADNGDVYYFGEDVSNYEDGKVANTEGSWLAGKDGAPPALIMPAAPQVGMKFNPENLPGVVYEQDEVLSVSDKATTPKGPITNALHIKETLMDGTIEYKLWAAGFGIVQDSSSDGKTVLVVAQRNDAAPRDIPADLQTIEAQAEAIIDDAPGGDWAKVGTEVTALADAWKAYAAQAASDGAPMELQDALNAALDQLQKAAAAKKAPGAMQAANDLSGVVYDLFGLYNPVEPTDLGRLDVLGRQVVFDAAAEESVVANNIAKVQAVWSRVKPLILARNGADVAKQFDDSLAAQQAAAGGGDGKALAAEASKALEIVDAMEKLY